MASPSASSLKQFRTDGCLSYALFDPAAREAVLIDPCTDLLTDYRTWLADHRLKLVAVLDTHTHADHYSASHLLRAETGAEIGMSHSTASRRPSRRLRAGDQVKFGAFHIEVIETPGHTEDSLAYRQGDMLFTGDTLLASATGRTDFEGSDPAREWESLQLLTSLPASTIVFPGHDYVGLLFSTLETERRENPHLQLPSQGAFTEHKLAERMMRPSEEILKRIEFNLAEKPTTLPPREAGGPVAVCGTSDRPVDRQASINVEKYRHKLTENAEGHLFIDVREPDEFETGHIPGTRCMPLSELAQHLPELRAARRVYVSCLSGMRGTMAARTLSYVGLPDVVNVNGGLKAWTQQGLPVTKPA